MNNENTNWEQSVAGVVIEDNKVLLARHTYGNGKGMLIIPGGYVNYVDDWWPKELIPFGYDGGGNVPIEYFAPDFPQEGLLQFYVENDECYGLGVHREVYPRIQERRKACRNNLSRV